MKPKEKAEELVDKFMYYVSPFGNLNFNSKQCALIAVDFAINDHKFRLGTDRGDYEYLTEVKQEIEKL